MANNDEHLHLYEVFENCFNKIAYRRDNNRDIPYDALYENECDKGLPQVNKDSLTSSHIVRGLEDSMGVNPENPPEHWPLGCTVYDVFQFAYTTIFGAYSTFLFLQTGHVSAPFIVHAFCNFMGFPDFGQLLELEQPKKTFLMISFVVGLVLWILLLLPLTDPLIYGNEVYLPYVS